MILEIPYMIHRLLKHVNHVTNQQNCVTLIAINVSTFTPINYNRI